MVVACLLLPLYFLMENGTFATWGTTSIDNYHENCLAKIAKYLCPFVASIPC